MTGNPLISLTAFRWPGTCRRDQAMRRSAGFTMIELMMVVAVIGILAVVAVVGYTKVIRKAHSSEIPAMFAELKAREEAYKAEKGKYLPACLAAPATPADSDCPEGGLGVYWPDPLIGGNQQMPVGIMPPRFQSLHVNVGRGGLYCQYEVVAGVANDLGSMGATGHVLFDPTFGGAAPIRNWYYLLAQCDWDGNPAVNATWWQRDDLTELGRDNELQ